MDQTTNCRHALRILRDEAWERGDMKEYNRLDLEYLRTPAPGSRIARLRAGRRKSELSGG